MKKIFLAVTVLALLGAGCFGAEPKPSSGESVPSTPSKTETPRPSRTYDASDKNPGISLNPIDAGKEIDSDAFRYKLLDVRQDGETYLVKLEVTNKTPIQLHLSVAEAFLSDKDDNSANNAFTIDFIYPRSNIGVDLGGDIAEFAPGQKVVGYYVFKLKEDRTAPSMYFIIRNIGYNAELQKVDGRGGLGYVDAFKVR